MGVLEAAVSAVGVLELTLDAVVVLKDVLSAIGVPELTLINMGVLEAATNPVPVAVTADPALVVVTADPATAAIVTGLGLATVKLKVAIKGNLNSKLGCPILAPSSTLGPSPFPLDLHLAMGPNI